MERQILEKVIELAKQSTDHGALYVLDKNMDQIRTRYYREALPEIFNKEGNPLSVLSSKEAHVIRQLAEMDGATIIDCNGFAQHFGATLRKERTFLNHGKRHAFALGTSTIDGLICILASEEDKHIRVFKGGICITDMDARTNLPPALKQKVMEVIDNPISKTLIVCGITISILTLNPIPALITITGSSALVSYGVKQARKLME